MQWTSLKYHYDSEGTFALSGVLELQAMFFSFVHDLLNTASNEDKSLTTPKV